MQNHKSYNEDFYGWAHEQANLIRNGDFKNMDIDNLVEEIECLARREKSTLKNQIKKFLLHKLKIKYQPYLHTRSWDISINNASIEVAEILEENPSLKSLYEEIFKKAYKNARMEACKETGLEESIFPEECPWKSDELLGSDSIK